MHRLIALCLLMLVAATGCELGRLVLWDRSFDECSNNEDCAAGQVCSTAGVGSRCETPCDSDDDCPDGASCQGETELASGTCEEVDGEA